MIVEAPTAEEIDQAIAELREIEASLANAPQLLATAGNSR
jgi:hypothetical protein